MKASTRGPLARCSRAAAKLMSSVPDGTATRLANAAGRAGWTWRATLRGAVALAPPLAGGGAVKRLMPSALAGTGAARRVASLVRSAVRLGVGGAAAATGAERP